MIVRGRVVVSRRRPKVTVIGRIIITKRPLFHPPLVTEDAFVEELHAKGFRKTGVPQEPFNRWTAEALRTWSITSDVNLKRKCEGVLATSGWYLPPRPWEELVAKAIQNRSQA